MLPLDALKDYLPRRELSPRDKTLLVLAAQAPLKVKEIRKVARLNGAPGARKWNISQLLTRSRCAVSGADGWELNKEGRSVVAAIVGDERPLPEADRLRAALAKVTSPEAHAFLEEAVHCYGARLYRAAVVLSWVGALWLLYSEVAAKHLPAFNVEAIRRNPKWRDAKNAESFARMQESEFLDVAEAIGVLGKTVKNQLKTCLDLRNGCGHPNTFALGENAVAHHIENLALNVFARFA